MQQAGMRLSSARQRLTGAAGRAGIETGERDKLVGVVLHELAVRLTPAQWRELCGWLPWDVRSLAGPRHAGRVPPSENLAAAVAAAADLPRPVAVVALRDVLTELARIVPKTTIPARLARDVPGL